MARLEFDVFARDHASDTLAKVGRAFKKIGDDADREGKRSGDRFGGGLKRWFRGDGQGLFTEIGKNGGTVFGSGLLGALKTPILGPAMVATLGAAVATVAPVVGGIAAGGIISGFGAGLAGLGIVFAAKSEQVQRIWSSTLTSMGEDMRLLSVPFEDTLIKIAGFAQRTFNAFKPALEQSFSTLAPVITKFVDAASRALEQLVPTIQPITDAFSAVLDAMGPALQSAVGSLASGMNNLADSVRKNPTALAETVKAVGDLTNNALALIATLNNVNGAFSRLTGGLSLVEVALAPINTTLIALRGSFAGLEFAVNGAQAGLAKVGLAADKTGPPLQSAAGLLPKVSDGYGKTGAAASGSVGPLNQVTDALTRQKSQFTSTIAAMGQWSSKAIASSNAAIGYQAALDDATASLKANGRTLDINTEKGRANKTALIGVAEWANRQAAAMDEAGASNKATAATAASARANFVRLATGMGMSKAEAKALAAKLIAIPNVSRTVTITTRNITYNDVINRKSTGQFGGGINAQPRAGGGPVKANEIYKVGENGVEIFVPETAGRIVPNDQLRGGRTMTTTVQSSSQIIIDGRTTRGSDRIGAEWLANLVRTNPALARQLKVLLS